MQNLATLKSVPKKVPEKVWEGLVLSQVRFKRVPKKVPEKVLGGFGAKSGQVHQVPKKNRRRYGRLWLRARSGSTGFWIR